MSETITAEVTTEEVTDDQNPTPADRVYTKAEMEEIVKYRLDRKEEQEKAKRKKAEIDAREAVLKEQGEYKPLAEQRAERIIELESRVAEAESLTEERDQLAALVQQMVEDELESAPDYVREAISDRSPQAQLEYVRKNREKWAAATEANGTARRGIPATPRGAGAQTREDAVRAAEDDLLRRRHGGRR
jgi:hypothetical protein